MEDGDVDHLTASHRDEDATRASLEAWLAGRPGVGSDVQLDTFEHPETNGVSSETVLFDASWAGSGDDTGDDSGERERRRYVARLPPDLDAYPIFPTYDLGRQARVMRLVRERTDAPVPQVHWYEPDEAHLGVPFFVMDRVDGIVPPDVMPYTFDGSWVTDATPEQRARLQARTVEVLAAVHGLEAEPDEVAFLRSSSRLGDDGSALRAHFEAEREYYDWVRGDIRYPVLDRAFERLEAHWPEAADAAPAVVCWGDSRIGNVLYQDFEPQAVLDWEMATLAPRELDVAWFVFLHRFFEDITAVFEMPGLPDFLERPTVERQYAEASGQELLDFDWFLTYSALRHGNVMIRATERQVAFGERPAPDDPEDLVMHRASIDALVAGTYWSSLGLA